MKQEKPYTTKIADGQITLTLKKLYEGRQVSISASYPIYVQFFNEETEKVEIRRLRKDQAEQNLFDSLQKQYA